MIHASRFVSIRILLAAAAFALPIASIAYLQVRDLNHAQAVIGIERDGVACLNRSYALLRSLGALEDSADRGATAELNEASADLVSSNCAQPKAFARLSASEIGTPSSRFAVARRMGNGMRTIAETSNLTYDTSHVTIAATAATAYQLGDVLPLFALAATVTDPIDVAKTQATAASRLQKLDDNIAELLRIAPWTRSELRALQTRQLETTARYFRQLDRWEEQPATRRPDVVIPMQAASLVCDQLFAALTRVLHMNLDKELEEIVRRRTQVMMTTSIALILALALIGLIRRVAIRRHQVEIDRFKEIALKEARFEAIFAGSPLAIAITDLSGSVLECNSAYRALVGASPVVADRLTLFAPALPSDDAGLSDIFNRLRDDAISSGPILITLTRTDAAAVCCNVTATLVRAPNDAAQYCAVTLQDITERQRREGRLQHKVTHDALTGISNRAYFIAELQRRLEQQRESPRFALLFIDVDDFKTVNDTLGHAAGDICLATVAQRIRSLIHEGDVVARYGGDEFAVLLRAPETIEQATELAAQLRDVLAAPICFEDTVFVVSSSIGIATDGGGGRDADAVIATADRAMYRDKRRTASRAATIHQRSVR